MVNHNIKKIFFLLFFSMILFFLGGCAAQKKIVDAYQDRPVDPETVEKTDTAASVPLPANEQRRTQETATAAAHEEILPSFTFVNDRIIAYEEKLWAWQEFGTEAAAVMDEEQRQKIEACRVLIQDILAGYNELHEFLLDASSDTGRELSGTDRFAAVERKDISFLESECQVMIKLNLQTGSLPAGTKNQLIEGKEQEIAEAMGRNDYARVVAVYEGIPAEDTPDLGIESVYSYGLALLRTGNARQSGMVLRNLLDRIHRESRSQQEFEIMKLVADISFGLGDYKWAYQRYADIINRYEGFADNFEWAQQQQSLISSRGERETEVKSFADLLLSYLSYNPRKDGYKVAVLARNFTVNYPDSPLYATASRILMESRDRADTWFTGIIGRIERYRAEKQYDEGLAYIEQIPRMNLLPEKQVQLRMLTDELISAQFEAAQIRSQMQERELEENWTAAQSHLRAKEYDEAIEIFSSLLETSYGERARMQIEDATQLAVQEDRRKAAELFVRANRMTDLNVKISLLLESRELLQNILIKYPGSSLADKVKSNLSRIEEEIISIDPNLLNSGTGEDFSRGDDSLRGQPFAERTPSEPANDRIDSTLSTRRDLQE
ncbi:MAG: hypothetical protein SCH71_06780 [Desulfobulbaceae bacterium]|nr:hypothetical protein [Desulfobulbaceae bacterium]